MKKINKIMNQLRQNHYPVMIEETRRECRGCLESLTVMENWSDGSRPSILEMVCFMESLADSEIPLEITELSSGSILLSIFAITRNPRSKFDFRVETKSSLETPPPLLRQLTVAEYEAERRPRLVGQRMTSWWWWWLRENGARGRWRGLNDAPVLVLVLVVMRERVKARADAI